MKVAGVGILTMVIQHMSVLFKSYVMNLKMYHDLTVLKVQKC